MSNSQCVLLLSTITKYFNAWNEHHRMTSEAVFYNRNGFAACSLYSMTKKKFVFFVTHPWAFQMECILVVQFFYFFLNSFCHSFITSWNFIPVFLLWFQKIFVQKLWCCYGCDFFPFTKVFCPFLLNKEKNPMATNQHSILQYECTEAIMIFPELQTDKLVLHYYRSINMISGYLKILKKSLSSTCIISLWNYVKF